MNIAMPRARVHALGISLSFERRSYVDASVIRLILIPTREQVSRCELEIVSALLVESSESFSSVALFVGDLIDRARSSPKE